MTQNDVTLNIIQRIILRLSKKVFVEYRIKPGWKAPIDHYAFKCETHGLVVDYPHGDKQKPTCPKCPSSLGKET